MENVSSLKENDAFTVEMTETMAELKLDDTFLGDSSSYPSEASFSEVVTSECYVHALLDEVHLIAAMQTVEYL